MSIFGYNSNMPLQSADNISDFESTQKKCPENVGLVLGVILL